MTVYGVQLPSTSISGSTGNDTLSFVPASATRVLSANTLNGIDGDDIIYLGPQGYTASASASFTFSGNGEPFTGAYRISARLIGSAGTVYTSTLSGSTINSGGTTGVGVGGVVTAYGAARQIYGSQFYGAAGNDTVALGNSFTVLTSTTLGGGAGDDIIGNFTYVNGVFTGAAGNASAMTAFSANKVFLEAGGGNDSINFVVSASDWDTSTIQGGQGNDTINFVMGNGGTAQSSYFFGGGGDDSISGSFQSFINSTIAGGGGNDAITFTGLAAQGLNLITLDAFNTASQYDGNDSFTGSFVANAYSSITIQAGGGNDTITISGSNDAGSNLFQLQGGNDIIQLEDISSSTVQAGAGNDSIHWSNIAAGTTIIQGGGGADSITVSAAELNVEFAAGTVYGGDGADVLLSAGIFTAGETMLGTVGYQTYSESTLSAMDTIALSAGSGQVYRLGFEFTTLTRGSQSETANGFTATNGIATFSAAYDGNVTARVNALNTSFTSAGTVVGFTDGSNQAYLFVQGGSSQTVIQVGDTQISGGTTGLSMTLANSNRTVLFDV